MCAVTKIGVQTHEYLLDQSLKHALVRQKGVTRKLYSPCGVENDVFSWDRGCILICQRPDARSSVGFPQLVQQVVHCCSGKVSA